jgi:HSP20 family molecular chaperone IbpA
MENTGVQKKQTVGSLWDPFWLMREMFGWGRSVDGPSFDVKETDDTYVCKVKVKLTLPEQADVAHAKAKLDNGELTLVVPKAAAATPKPDVPPQRSRRPAANGGGSGGRTRRRRRAGTLRRG